MSEPPSRDESDESQEQLIEQLLERYDEASALGLPAVLPKVDGLPPQRIRELESLLRRIDLVNQAARQHVLDSVGVDPPRTAAAATEPFAGEMIGRFRVLRELGRGGYGIVFLAYDSGIGRLVAIKLPRPEVLVTPELVARFLREAQAAGRIDHPHVLPVHEAAEDGGMCYLVTPYCRGLSLAEWFVEQQPVSATDVAQLGASLADALACAHEAGVLHRDIKPANILLDISATDASSERETLKKRTLSTFVPKLTDFGLAKLLQSSDLETRTGTMVGTPTYMAPEQATGRYADVRTDVYSLGLVMYELLTGQLPADASTVAGLAVPSAQGQIIPPRQLRSSIPRDLEAVVLKCLEQAPVDRYASAAALAEDLRRFMSGKSTIARPAGMPRKIWKALRRRPAMSTVLVLLTAALCSLVAGDRWYALRLERTEVALRRGEYVRDIRHAAAARKRGAINETRALLAKYDVGRAAAKLRGFEWFWLRNSLRDVGRIITTPHGEVYGVTFSPDGKTLYSGGADGVIRAWDARSGAPLFELRGHNSCVNQVAFAADGHTLGSVSCDGTARLWDVRTRSQIRTVVNHGREITCMAFAHTRPWLAIDSHRGQVQVYDTSSGALLVELNSPRENCHIDAIAFNNTDEMLAATVGAKLHSGVWQTKDWQRLSQRDFGAVALAFVGRQQQLVLGSRSTYDEPTLWSTETNAFSAGLGRLPSMIQSMTGMRERDVVFAGGADGSLYTFGLHGETNRVMLTSTARIQGLDISQDDRYLASAGYDGKVRVWDLRQDVEKIDCGGDKPLSHGVLSHDGHWLAVVDAEYKTTIWNCRENHPESSRPMLEPLKFSPSGKCVIARNKLTGQLALVRVPDLQSVETLGDLQGVIEMTVSADDRTVALLAADRSVRIVDLTHSHDKRQLRLPTDGPVEGIHIAVSPDGTQLLWLEQGQLAQYAVNINTGERGPLPESLGFMSLAMTDSGASLDPSGRHVILTAKNSGDLSCQETISGRAPDPWRHPEKLIANCAWSPDGSRVVVSTKNGTPVVIDPVTGEQLCELDTALEPIRSNLIFSPNADELIAFTTDGVSTCGYLYRWRAPRD